MKCIILVFYNNKTKEYHNKCVIKDENILLEDIKCKTEHESPNKDVALINIIDMGDVSG